VRRALALAAVLGLVLIGALHGLYRFVAPDLGLVTVRGAPGTRAVALTFDDGPDPRTTPRVLALLGSYGAHATFFVVGRRVLAHPGLLRALLAAGDELGNHGFDHPSFTALSPADQRRQVRDGAAVLRRLTGSAPRFFRPPYGRYGPGTVAAARAAHERIVLWTLSFPADDPPDARHVGRLVRRVVPGDILLLHDGGPAAAADLRRLPLLLSGLAARALRVETVGRLLAGG
jgi:peptidoglycan/xylan/chitin deacetylase (PgdA/CDA1 family)